MNIRLMKRILTGLQPSGELTLGSLIGSIGQMVKYQDEYDSFIFVPDMHAITIKQDPKLLKERIRKNVALYLACGVDPSKNTIYIQSENFRYSFKKAVKKPLKIPKISIGGRNTKTPFPK